MFIGWIRAKTFSADLEALSSSVTIDKLLILNTFNQNPSLCFGAYDDYKLVACISAYEIDKSIYINNFCYLEDTQTDVKKRLLKLLLNNINKDAKTILIMAKKEEKELFNGFEFNIYAKFNKALYGSSKAVFNFTNAMAKSITNENYFPSVTKMDKKAFNEDRSEYIKNTLQKQSSLFLSTEFGYQHSYAVSKSLIKISPWVMSSEAYSDAQKMLRGVIYHRGLKNILSFIPSDIKEIIDLYKSYKFDISDEYYLLYKNEKPSINLEMIYGF